MVFEYDYIFAVNAKALVEKLNELAKKGWEAVNFVKCTDFTLQCLVKRIVKET